MFSVIIPTYQRNIKLVQRAIESVKNQTFQDWELLLIDDNIENTIYFNDIKKIKEKYIKEDNISVIQDGINRGANGARNTGIKLSKGEYIAFLDSDDEWNIHYLSQVNKYLVDNNDVALLSTAYRIIFKNMTQKVHKNSNKGNIFFKEIYGDLMSPTSAIIIKKSVFSTVGTFDENLEARQDYDMWLRVCEKYKVGFLNKILVDIYRDGHERISDNYIKHIEATKKVLEKIISNPIIDERYHKKIKSMHYRYITIVALKNADKFLASQYGKKAIKLSFNLKNLLIYIFAKNLFVFNFARKIYKKFLCQKYSKNSIQW